MIKLKIIAASAVVVGLATPALSGTLTVTFKSSNSMTTGPLSNQTTLTSPSVTMGFANGVDYSQLATPSTGPKFGAADLQFVSWVDIQNLAFIEQNPSFENPPLTQAVFDTLTYVFSSDYPAVGNQGIFSPVTGAVAANAQIGFTLSNTTTFTNGPMVLLRGRSGNQIRPSGNWDSDTYNDAAPWNFGLTEVLWNPTATAFPADEIDNGTSAVPLPATLPLLLAGIGVAGAVGRRKRQR